ncbi:MAG: carboxypeptidase-like regulatory domain-containing protein [Bryobacteraceae bacterium]
MIIAWGFLPAQDTTGTITGTVLDASNAAVPNAEILITNEETGLRRSARSNETGLYRVPLLPVGRYSIQARKEGFRSEIQQNVRIEILQVRTVDFNLQVGAVNETVTVESTALLLEAETSQAGEVIKTEQVTNLPLGRRNFMQLTFLAPMATLTRLPYDGNRPRQLRPCERRTAPRTE